MNQELIILLVSVNEAAKDIRHSLCKSNEFAKCTHVSCCNCPLQCVPRGYTVDIANTARELAYEPRTNSNT